MDGAALSSMADDDAYEISVPRRKEETIAMPVAPTEVDTGPLPEWAKKWKHEKEVRRPSTVLSGRAPCERAHLIVARRHRG